MTTNTTDIAKADGEIVPTTLTYAGTDVGILRMLERAGYVRSVEEPNRWVLEVV